MPSRAKATAGHSVFISYASRERSHAEAICAALERDGVRCWIAPRDGTAGASYAAFLVEAIASSRLVVLVFSRAANRSDAVLNELEIAFHRGIPILPVRVQNVEPSRAAEFYLRRRHWFDAFVDFATRLDALTAAVRDALAAPSPAKRRDARKRDDAAVSGNLPVSGTSFLGRERELAEIVRALDGDRLVTLWGTGGVGKTRVALEVARARRSAFTNGAWFVDLAPVCDAGAVMVAVAAALGIREERGRGLELTLAAELAARHALIVLDNCEHVVAGCARLVERVLHATSAVTFVCTSREPLAIAGEHVVHIEPFDVPSSGEVSAQAAVIRLFCERAASAGSPPLQEHDLRDVALICARLDGIPFAIELAAARTRSMTPAQIVAALDARFHLLTGGSRTALPRQQTLRGTLDWSYGLLPANERAVLRRLAVFSGGWGLEAMRGIVAFGGLEEWDVLDALHGLVDKSLVVARTDGERYRLHETTRQYAGERLEEAGEAIATRRRHADYYRALAERAFREQPASGTRAVSSALRMERTNFFAAHDWALAEGREPLLAAALCGSLAATWDFDGMQQDGLRRLRASIDALPADAGGSEAAIVWFAFALLTSSIATTQRELAAAEHAVALARAAGDARIEARALSLLAHIAAQLGDERLAETSSERALAMFRALDDSYGIAGCLAAQALHAGRRGEFARARRLYDEVLAIDRAHGETRMVAIALLSIAELEFAAGDVARAIEVGREAVAASRAIDHRTLLLHALVNLGAYLVENGAVGEARAVVRDALDACRDRTYAIFGCKIVEEIAVLAALAGDTEAACRLHRSSAVHLADLGYVREATEQRVYERAVALLAGDEPHADAAAAHAGSYESMIEDAFRALVASPVSTEPLLAAPSQEGIPCSTSS